MVRVFGSSSNLELVLTRQSLVTTKKIKQEEIIFCELNLILELLLALQHFRLRKNLRSKSFFSIQFVQKENSKHEMKLLILNFILAHAKTYAKINQPTTDMSIVISTAAVTEKRSNFLTLFDTNDATDYTIVEVQRNRSFLQVRLQTSASIFLLTIRNTAFVHFETSKTWKFRVGSSEFESFHLK